MQIGEALRGVVQRRTEQPKTVLGFYAISSAVMFSGMIGLVSVLAITGSAVFLIPYLAITAVVLFVALMLGVFLINVNSPEKLMLGQVTGSEFVEIQRVQLGDSRSGERVELIPRGGAPYSMAAGEIVENEEVGTRASLPVGAGIVNTVDDARGDNERAAR
jgi:hypothetical protein